MSTIQNWELFWHKINIDFIEQTDVGNNNLLFIIPQYVVTHIINRLAYWLAYVLINYSTLLSSDI